MKFIIDFAVTRPRRTLALLIVLTAIFASGFPGLTIEPSTEALMPRKSAEYLSDMRIKKVFGDSKLYLLSLIESKKAPLFSAQSFELINEAVSEIEEFRIFDYERETARLTALLEAGNIEAIETAGEKNSEDDSESNVSDIVEGGYFDPFAIDQPLPEDIYVKPVREKRTYSFENYRGVSPQDLAGIFDAQGLRQLETVYYRHRMQSRVAENPQRKFDAGEYETIVGEFEQAYLLKSMEVVKGTMNPVSGEDISGTDDSLVPVKLVEQNDEGERLLPVTQKDFAAYKKKLLANPVFENNIYSLHNGELSALALNVQLRPHENAAEASRYMMDLINKYNGNGELEFTVNGVPVYERYIQDYMQRDMRLFLPLVFLVVVATFFLNFRSFRGVVLPTVSVILAIVWTMGLMGHCKIPVTMVVNALPTILMAVASSYSIHLYNQYLNDTSRIANQGLKAGLIGSMSRISFTVFLAAFTTFIGFLTLVVNQVVSLKHFGIFSAAGTMFAMIIASTLIPAVLSMGDSAKSREGLTKGAHKGQKNILLLRVIEKTGSAVIAHPRLTLGAAAVIIAVCIFGITKLRIENSPLFNFKEDSYIIQADHKVGAALNGTLAINLTIDTGREGGAKDIEFLRKTDDLVAWIVSAENRERYHLLSAYSFGDIIKRMNKAMSGDDPSYYTLPDSSSTVEDYLMIYSGEDRDSDGRIDSMERFVDPSYRYANIFIKSGTYNGKLYSSRLLTDGAKAIREHLAKDPYFSKYKNCISGQAINFGVLNRLVASGQLYTIISTLIIIGVLIFILFRSVRAAFVSLIPISCSVIVAFGLMGYLDIPLEIAKSIIASLTIGIGIDDTIHMLKTIRSNSRRGMPLKEAVMSAYHESGLAIVYTSLALVFGFSVLMLSEFKALYYLGWLVSINMIVTTIAALFVLPPAILLLNIRFNDRGIRTEHDEDGELVA